MGIPRQTDGQQGAEKEIGDACGDAHGSPDGNNKIGGGGNPHTPPAGGHRHQPANACCTEKLPKPSWEYKSDFERHHDVIYINSLNTLNSRTHRWWTDGHACRSPRMRTRGRSPPVSRRWFLLGGRWRGVGDGRREERAGLDQNL